MTIELLKKRIIRYKLYLSQTGYYKNKKQNMWLSYKKIVPPLLKAGMYDLTGTDVHSLEHFKEWLGTRIGSRDRDMLSARFQKWENEISQPLE